MSGIMIEGHIFRFAACQFGQKTAGSPLIQGARDEASEGVYSLETHQVGLQKVFITKSPVAPPSPGIGPGHSGGPIGPTAKGLCEYQARFPYSMGLVSKGQTMIL